MNIVSLILVIALNCLFLCEAHIEWPWSSHWMLCFSVKHTLSVLFISSSCFCMAARCCLQVHIFYFWSYHVQSDRLDLFRHTPEELFLSMQWKRARWSDCCHCQWISNCLLWISCWFLFVGLLLSVHVIISWLIQNYIMNIASLTLVNPLNCLFLCEA